MRRRTVVSSSISAATLTVGTKPILATVVGIPVAAIVLAAASGSPVPIVDSYAAGLVALLLLGATMCAWGMQAMAARYGYVRASLVGAPLGVVILALILSGLFGWELLLGPATTALGGTATVPPERAAIVSVGAIMLAKWLMAWLAYLPRGAVSPPRP
jgi:hypothetical protein